MKYAVVRITGKQYRVKEGQEFLVDKVVADKVEPEVLLVVNDAKVEIGKPVLTKAKVALTVVTKEEKGDKVVSKTFKAKTRIRKTKASRPRYTRLKVKSISL